MKPIIVNSHERSGTHFLMNTLALNFGYISNPYINFDLPDLIPHASDNILVMLERLNHQPRNIIKSHYEGTFFREIINRITKTTNVFYIYREEEGMFKSCLKHWNSIKWAEAPKCVDIEELKITEPYGACMRYQYKQYPSMYARWQGHKASWKEQMGGTDIIYVRYEDLVHRFDKTLRIISRRIQMPIIGGIARKPDKSKTVQDGKFNEKEIL